VTVGELQAPALLAVLGLVLAAALTSRKVPGALLIAIGVVSALSWAVGAGGAPKTLVQAPDFSLLFALDVGGALSLALVPALVALVFTDLFDSISTFVGVSEAAELLDEHGQPRRLSQGLVVDALATLFSGLLGTSSGTTYIESAAGIESGARTGLASVVTALCFVPCLFLAPLFGAIPAHATAPVLIVVGALMFRRVTSLRAEDLEDALPAFLTVLLIPLTFSITQGILWGFISYVALYVLRGRGGEVSRVMYVVAAASVGLLVLENV
jgi:AGZA family xanthine/uracil permease-like MFS transporter